MVQRMIRRGSVVLVLAASALLGGCYYAPYPYYGYYPAYGGYYPYAVAPVAVGIGFGYGRFR